MPIIQRNAWCRCIFIDTDCPPVEDGGNYKSVKVLRLHCKILFSFLFHSSCSALLLLLLCPEILLALRFRTWANMFYFILFVLLFNSFTFLHFYFISVINIFCPLSPTSLSCSFPDFSYSFLSDPMARNHLNTNFYKFLFCFLWANIVTSLISGVYSMLVAWKERKILTMV